MIKHRKSVLALWVIALALGLFSSAYLNSHLTTALTIPGTSSAQTDSLLSQHFNENIEGTFTIVYPFRNANSSQIKQYEDQIEDVQAHRHHRKD